MGFLGYFSSGLFGLQKKMKGKNIKGMKVSKNLVK
jgi:hypothetical protein